MKKQYTKPELRKAQPLAQAAALGKKVSKLK